MSQHAPKLEDGTENHLKTGGEQITYANKTTAGSVGHTTVPSWAAAAMLAPERVRGGGRKGGLGPWARGRAQRAAGVCAVYMCSNREEGGEVAGRNRGFVVGGG